MLHYFRRGGVVRIFLRGVRRSSLCPPPRSSQTLDGLGAVKHNLYIVTLFLQFHSFILFI